jgi:hypothetical protein
MMNLWFTLEVIGKAIGGILSISVIGWFLWTTWKEANNRN